MANFGYKIYKLYYVPNYIHFVLLVLLLGAHSIKSVGLEVKHERWICFVMHAVHNLQNARKHTHTATRTHTNINSSHLANQHCRLV